MSTNNFLEEISGYSIDELTLIFETQKDLYSVEEMEIIKRRIQELEEQEDKQRKDYISRNLPKEILCPKCDGLNPFENDNCCYCGYRLDKKKYYSVEYYQNDENETKDSKEYVENGSSYTFQFIISFLIPLVGFILGAILLGKDDEYERSNGKTCIILGIISVVLSVVIFGFYKFNF